MEEPVSQPVSTNWWMPTCHAIQQQGCVIRVVCNISDVIFLHSCAKKKKIKRITTELKTVCCTFWRLLNATWSLFNNKQHTITTTTTTMAITITKKEFLNWQHFNIKVENKNNNNNNNNFICSWLFKFFGNHWSQELKFFFRHPLCCCTF